MSAPVPNTCPYIDEVINKLDSIESDVIYEFKKAREQLENLRTQNEQLRNWGNELENEIEELKEQIADLQNQLDNQD
jgi:polyhydroxyalkanoate synthesis regulator phasin